MSQPENTGIPNTVDPLASVIYFTSVDIWQFTTKTMQESSLLFKFRRSSGLHGMMLSCIWGMHWLINVSESNLHFVGSLGKFLQKASDLRLPLLVSNSAHTCTSQQADSHSLLKFGMNAKKSHEVDSFSRHVHHLTTLGNITQVSMVVSQGIA